MLTCLGVHHVDPPWCSSCWPALVFIMLTCLGVHHVDLPWCSSCWLSLVFIMLTCLGIHHGDSLVSIMVTCQYSLCWLSSVHHGDLPVFIMVACRSVNHAQWVEIEWNWRIKFIEINCIPISEWAREQTNECNRKREQSEQCKASKWVREVKEQPEEWMAQYLTRQFHMYSFSPLCHGDLP